MPQSELMDKLLFAQFILAEGMDRPVKIEDAMRLVVTTSMEDLKHRARYFRMSNKCEDNRHDLCNGVSKYPDANQYQCACGCHK